MKVHRLIYMLAVTLLSSSLFAGNLPQASPVITSRMLPAVFKSKSGPTQKLQVLVKHEGAPATATIRLANDMQKTTLSEGENKFLFEMPEVHAVSQIPITLTIGKEKTTVTAEIKPVRHWQVNFVQHTHTDIGYTRSQMEILAEHLRYIDYALDYCDATDNYPDYAKFRWTCEISWAVSEYMKCRPAAQVARLKQRVKEGRIELAAMYLNF